MRLDPQRGRRYSALPTEEGVPMNLVAGATGSVGPNLDDKKPAYALVIDRVTNGKGVMPSFKSRLNETQIQDVAKYVSSVAGT